MTNLINIIIAWVLIVIAKFGYFGIFVTMVLESAIVPIPSEVVLPFSGFLASNGSLNFTAVVLIATIANLVGASVIYFIGFFGGRRVIDNYGKYVFIQKADVIKIDLWFSKNQAWTTLVARLLPGVRGFSSLIIGAAEGVRFYKFLFYTFLGSLIWNFGLVYAGYWAGANWDFLQPYFHKVEIVIGIAIALGIILFIYKHAKEFRTRK